MPAEILTSDSAQKLPEPNIFKKLLNSWIFLDRFVKVTIITMALLLLVTPVIIAQKFSLFQRASLNTQVTVYPSNQVFNIPSDFFGQSADDADGSRWDSTVGDKTVGLVPLVIRYPGSFAECWDWKSGAKLPSSVFPCDNHANLHVDTLAQFSKIVQRTGATPVFVLNMYSSGATIEDKITDQINFLKTAQSTYGMPIKYIELGNEVADRIPTHVVQFPTVDEYARESNEWIRRLFQEFPGAKIAVSGLSEGDSSTLLAWNNRLISSTPQADAIVLHMYASPYYSNAVSQADAISYIKTDDGRRNLFALPYFLEGRFERILSLLPGNQSIWITEHGIIDDKFWAVYGTWAEGLVRAVIGLHFIEHSDRVSFAIPQQIYGSADYGLVFRDEGSGFWGKPNGAPSSTPETYTATGIAYNEIGLAVGKDTKKAIKLQFSPLISDTSFGNSYPTLIGYLFIRSSGNQAIIINSGSQDLQLSLSNTDMLNSFDTGEILSGDYATLVTGDTSGSPTNILKATASVADDRQIFIPAYSVTRLSGNRTSNSTTPTQTPSNQCSPSCNQLPFMCYYHGPGPHCSCGQIICVSPTPSNNSNQSNQNSYQNGNQNGTGNSSYCDYTQICQGTFGQARSSCIAYAIAHGCSQSPTPTFTPSPTPIDLTTAPESSITPTSTPTSQPDQSQSSRANSNTNTNSNQSCDAPYGCYYTGSPSSNCGDLICIPTLTPEPTATPTLIPTQATSQDNTTQNSNSDFSMFSQEPQTVKRQWEESVITVVGSILGNNPLLKPILQLTPAPSQSQGLIKIQNSTQQSQQQTQQSQQQTQSKQNENESGINLPQINIQQPGITKKKSDESVQVGIVNKAQIKKTTKYFSVFDVILNINNVVAAFVKNLILGNR